MHGVYEDSHCSNQGAAALELQEVQPISVPPPKGAKNQGRQEALYQTATASEDHYERDLLFLCEHYLKDTLLDSQLPRFARTYSHCTRREEYCEGSAVRA